MLNRIVNYGAFIILTALWLGFGAALMLNQQFLDTSWQTLTGLPVLVQGLVALIILPVVGGLWIWESDLPVIIRLLFVAGLAWITVYMFFPRRVSSGQANRKPA